VTEHECTELFGGESWAPNGVQTATIMTRDVHDVRVLPMHGDPILTDGIGHIDYNGPTVTLLRCGIFEQNKPLPRVNDQ
jgi:hypothetical protein